MEWGVRQLLGACWVSAGHRDVQYLPPGASNKAVLTNKIYQTLPLSVSSMS